MGRRLFLLLILPTPHSTFFTPIDNRVVEVTLTIYDFYRVQLALRWWWLFQSSLVAIEIPEDEEEPTPEQALNALLEQFKSNQLPITSKFYSEDGHATQREFKPPTVLQLWRHAWFAASKGSSFPIRSVQCIAN